MPAVTLSREIQTHLGKELDQVFREHYELVYRTAYGVTASPQDAEDVLQTIFLRLACRKFPPDLTTNPKAYLYRAAVNVSLNTVRKRKRDVFTAEAERFVVAKDTREAESLEALHRRLYEAIAELDSEVAQLLILRYVHNYSDSAIASLLGKSRSVIAVRLYRARARLRRLMRGEGL
jgi:RNA polymerase sigma-70 factor (ECF subfamily)